MMKQYYSILLRLYPTEEQKRSIDLNINCCRFLYNKMLEDRKNAYDENNKDKSKVYGKCYKTEKEYKDLFPFLKEADSTALKKTTLHLENAYNNFFKSLSGRRQGGNVNFPTFKKEKPYGNYSTSNPKIINIKTIKLPKIGIIKAHCNYKIIKYDKICYATVIKKPTNKYFCSITLERNVEENKKVNISNNNNIIGLDMSLSKFFVDDNGNSPAFEKIYRKYEKKIKRLQHLQSKKIKNSKKYKKIKKSLNLIYEKIENKRKDFTEKLSTKIIKEYDITVIETLDLKRISQELNLGKSIMELGYSSFIQQLKYKAEWYGKYIIEADKWFPSSKICNICGFKYKNLQLKDRKWVCPNCGSIINRDENAARNLKDLGVACIHKCLQSKEHNPTLK